MNQDLKKTTEEAIVDETYLINIRMFERINGKWTLVGRKCKNCGAIYVFPKVTCPSCLLDNQFEVVPFSGKGKLYSYAIVTTAPPGYKVPVVIAYVDVIEGPRYFALLDVDEPFDKLRI